METTLTPKNLQDIFDNIMAQYDAVKTAETAAFNSLRGYNLDLFSHFSGKPDADAQIPLVSSLVEFQRGIRDLAFTYDSMSGFTQFKTLFTALDSYFRSDTALTDKTINGFMAINEMKITDDINALYKGIIGRYLQAKNLLVAKDLMIYKTVWNGTALTVDPTSPSSAVFNNTSYLSTAVDGITYAPFYMRLVPTGGFANVVFTITFSDNTTQVFDYTSSAIPEPGVQMTAQHSGIKSVAVSYSGSIPSSSGFEVYADYRTMTFDWPTGWECYNNLDNGIQCYIGSASGQRIRLGSTYRFAKGATTHLYLRINPSVLGGIEGKFTIGATTLDYGTFSDPWYVNEYDMTSSADISLTANAVPL